MPSATIIRRTDDAFIVRVAIPSKGPMLEAEQAIRDALNQAGVAATEEVPARFDTDDAPIRFGPTEMTSMGRVPEQYQTPYGVATVARHVYRTSQGGPTFCPLDQNARIVVSSTPRFAKMVAFKYAGFGAGRVVADLAENHGRTVARSLVRDVAGAVAAVAPAKEQDWAYELPVLEKPVATIAIGLDGTCLLMCQDGWREAMVGALGFYDQDGERLHTICTAATPEYGELTFFDRLDREIDRVKAAYPEALYVGPADGAKDNRTYPERKARRQVVDFYHATQYIRSAAEDLFAENGTGMREWVDSWCHQLKHDSGAAHALIVDLEERGKASGRRRLPAKSEAALTYFRNQARGDRMAYAGLVVQHIPIGSGVTEAACKVLVRQRLCGSGMRWKERGAAAVLSLRCLTYTAERWGQFWGRIGRCGCPVAA